MRGWQVEYCFQDLGMSDAAAEARAEDAPASEAARREQRQREAEAAASSATWHREPTTA